MKVAIVAPEPTPAVRGGTERAVEGLRDALADRPDVDADVVKLPVDESNLPALIRAYEHFSLLDLGSYDRVISVKYPAWMVDHPDHAVYMFHPLRGLYDTYHLFGLSEEVRPQSPPAVRICEFIERNRSRDALFEFFGRFSELMASLPPDAPDLAFPGPVARAIVHWLDAIALDPARITDYYALSRTVAARPGYFPDGVAPTVVPLPGDLTAASPPRTPGSHLFTASRLDGPKRIGLLVDAMAHVTAEVPLKIAGTGPLADELRDRARNDPRIQFLGFVPDDELVTLYRDAIAVPFVPWDEDLGLISVEAGGQGAPVVTCTDSGGPTEFVADGVNGLIAAPTAASLGTALDRVASDPAWARRMGIAAHRRATGLDWPTTAKTLLGAHGSATTPPTSRPDAGTTGRAGGRPRIVSLATYGIAEPAHGGQLRVHHLCRALAATMDVHQLALDANAPATRSRELAPGLECTVVARTPEQVGIEDTLGLSAGHPVTDIMSGIDARLTPAFVDRLDELGGDADLIVLEQPFLYPALKQLGIDVPFVVNTQNVEWDLRDSTLPASRHRATFLDAVGQIEALALTRAAAVTACSEEDARRLGQLYRVDPAEVTIVPNGTIVPAHIPTPDQRRRFTADWLRRFRWNMRREAEGHLAVFFGSWHPPNLDAAEFLITLARERRDLLIVSAGNHGKAFSGRVLPDNIVFPGPVSERAKDALLASATVALNPMRTGSGTNLKIIEFLAHGAPTVSTPFGARGLDLTHGRELLLAEVEGFSDAIDEVLADPGAAAERVARARAFAHDYDWDVIGSGYRRLVTTLVAS